MKKILFVVVLLACSFGFTAKLFSQSYDFEKACGDAQYYIRTDPLKSVYYANEIIAMANREDKIEYVVKGNLLLGQSYMHIGDYVMGFEAMMKAKEICPSSNEYLLANVYKDLGKSYMFVKDLDKAFNYLDRATRIFMKLKDSLNLAEVYNTRGLCYIHIPDNNSAEKYFKLALGINRRHNKIESVASNINNLCLYEGNSKEKIELLKEAIKINEDAGRVWSLGENYNNLGTQYFYNGDYKMALSCLLKAQNYIKQINASELNLDNYRYLSWVYAALNDYKSAYFYIKSLAESTEQTKQGEKVRAIELENLEKRLELTQENAQQKEQIYNIGRTIYIYTIIFLLFSAISLIILYYSFKSRQRKKLQLLEAKSKLDIQRTELAELKLKNSQAEKEIMMRELDYNKDELINIAFFVKSRNELLANIQNKIKEAYKLPENEMVSKLRELNMYIAQFNASNTETEVLIEKINEGFIYKLQQHYPHLSKNEQRLASLLRIGLSSKEIASIIGSIPKTVDMARYRLRKKMNLDSDESLRDCLSNL